MKLEHKYNLKLKDKNGKEIYHLDKIRFSEHTGIISYNISSCRFIITWDDGTTRPINEHFASEIEVID